MEIVIIDAMRYIYVYPRPRISDMRSMKISAKHPFSICFFCLLIIFGSCASTVFTKEEQEFTNKLSSVLRGATVEIKKGIAVSTSEGSFKKFEIDISNLKLDSNSRESELLFASSIPAYQFLVELSKSHLQYKYVDVVVTVTPDEQIRKRYTINDLQLFDSCLPAFQGFMYGVGESNKDSLIYYCESEVFAANSAGNLMSTLSKADKDFGKPTDHLFQGFTLDTARGKKVVIFTGYLIRPKMDNKVGVSINADSKKVRDYSF